MLIWIQILFKFVKNRMTKICAILWFNYFFQYIFLLKKLYYILFSLKKCYYTLVLLKKLYYILFLFKKFYYILFFIQNTIIRDFSCKEKQLCRSQFCSPKRESLRNGLWAIKRYFWTIFVKWEYCPPCILL